MPLRLTTCPKKGNSSLKKKHFSGLSFSPACLKRRKTCSKCNKWSLKVFDPTLISSMYTTTYCQRISRNTVSIKRWKVAGALHNPNGITVNSYVPNLVIKVDFSWSLWSSSTCQNPLARSSEENH